MDQSDDSPDFYINICQPLNPIPGVTCPPGAAVCADPDNGPPIVRQFLVFSTVQFSAFFFILCADDLSSSLFLKCFFYRFFCFLKDIGRTTSGPDINSATGEVSITYRSTTKCAADPSQNYTSTIIFTCQRGLELVCSTMNSSMRSTFTFTNCSETNQWTFIPLLRALHRCWGCRSVSICLSGRPR